MNFVDRGQAGREQDCPNGPAWPPRSLLLSKGAERQGAEDSVLRQMRALADDEIQRSERRRRDRMAEEPNENLPQHAPRIRPGKQIGRGGQDDGGPEDGWEPVVEVAVHERFAWLLGCLVALLIGRLVARFRGLAVSR